MAITFFKTPRNKKFNYKPVYYDQKKEEMARLKKTAIEEGSDDYEAALRERMRMRWKRSSGTQERKASRQRLVIIIVVIFMLFYLAFFI